MTTANTIDWKSLNGKFLKIIVAEPNNTVIGIDEESGKSYLLHEGRPILFHAVATLEETKRPSWWRG